MKNKITKLFLAIGVFYSGGQMASAQSFATPEKVLQATNTEFLIQFAKDKEIEYKNNLDRAVRIAKEKNMPISGSEDEITLTLVESKTVTNGQTQTGTAISNMLLSFYTTTETTITLSK